MKIKRFLWGLAPVLNLVFVALESALGGGAFYTLKTGRHLGATADVKIPVPDASWWWDFVPAVGIGVAGPLCAALVMFKVIIDPEMNRKLRRVLTFVFWYYTLAYTTCGTIYVLSQPVHLTFPETLEAYGLGGATPFLVWWLLSANCILPGAMLAAMAHDAKVVATEQSQAEQEEQAKKQREQVRSLGEDTVKVLDAFRESPYGMLTRKDVELLTGLPYSVVHKVVHDLVEKGRLMGDSTQRGTTFTLIEES